MPTNLRSDTSAANALNRDVSIYGLAGGDSFFYVRTAGYNPGTAYDCGYSSWSPISSFAGWLLSFEGDAGSDIMEGADGSKPMWMYANGTSGGDYFNYLFGFSSAITMLGYVSPDDMISDTTGGAEILRGFDGGDCLHDFSNTFGEFNCGAGSDVRHFSNTGTANCENTTSCCGLC